jgi:integrase
MIKSLFFVIFLRVDFPRVRRSGFYKCPVYLRNSLTPHDFLRHGLSPKYAVASDTGRTQRRYVRRDDNWGDRMKLAERRDRRNPDAVSVKEIEPPPKGNRIVYDSEIKGFGVRVTAAGARSFVLNYVFNGRERRITIGNYPEWGVEQARNRAMELRRAIDGGTDPLAVREEARAAPTVAELVEKYRNTHLQKKRENSRLGDERNLKNWVLPHLGSIKVADVRYADIDKIHRKISETAPIQANRVVALLSKLFSLSIKWEMRTDNPCVGVDKNAETKRKRYLTSVELAALTEALQESREVQSANAIRLLLLTGARRNEVLSATWSQFDLVAGFWTKPGATTKQKTEHRVPLSAAARQLLEEMFAERSKIEPMGRSEFVFPGAPGKPQQDIKKFWSGVTKAASLLIFERDEGEAGRVMADLRRRVGGRQPTWTEWTVASEKHWAGRKDSAPVGITDVHVHDLRHTYASVLVSAGLSLPIIGALLGHTQVQTTQRYAHLFDDSLKEATNRAADLILGK